MGATCRPDAPTLPAVVSNAASTMPQTTFRRMQEVGALCDRIVVIARGRVVADAAPEALRAQTGAATLEDAFVKIIGSEEGLAA